MKYEDLNNSRDKIFFDIKGLIHREDGPALEWANGTKAWFVNGIHHRIDGPAIEYASGDKEWYINGKRHRIDGPAFEGASGYKGWYVNSITISNVWWFLMILNKDILLIT